MVFATLGQSQPRNSKHAWAVGGGGLPNVFAYIAELLNGHKLPEYL